MGVLTKVPALFSSLAVSENVTFVKGDRNLCYFAIFTLDKVYREIQSTETVEDNDRFVTIS